MREDYLKTLIFLLLSVVSVIFIAIPYHYIVFLLLPLILYLFILITLSLLVLLYKNYNFFQSKKLHIISSNLNFIANIKFFKRTQRDILKMFIEMCVYILLYVVSENSYISIISGLLSGFIVSASIFYTSYLTKYRIFMSKLMCSVVESEFYIERINNIINLLCDSSKSYNDEKLLTLLSESCAEYNKSIKLISEDINDSIYTLDIKNKKIENVVYLIVNRKHMCIKKIITKIYDHIFICSSISFDIIKKSEEVKRISSDLKLNSEKLLGIVENIFVKNNIKKLKNEISQDFESLKIKNKKYKILTNSMKYGAKC